MRLLTYVSMRCDTRITSIFGMKCARIVRVRDLGRFHVNEPSPVLGGATTYSNRSLSTIYNQALDRRCVLLILHDRVEWTHDSYFYMWACGELKPSIVIVVLFWETRHSNSNYFVPKTGLQFCSERVEVTSTTRLPEGETLKATRSVKTKTSRTY